MSPKNHYKKIFVITAALLILFAPVVITVNSGMTAGHEITIGFGIARAQTTPATPNLYDCSTNPVTCSIFFLSLTVNGYMAVLISVGAWLVRVGLQFNDNIFNSPGVQTGFSVSLAIANLGFVLGIIIIAIATILRNQTYGIKQLLWKLVVMAILVNFGLVITAPIVGFASSMSNYFINATSPNSMSIAGYEGYANTMMQAFAPQLFIPGASQVVSAGAAEQAACLPAPTTPGGAALCLKAAQDATNAIQQAATGQGQANALTQQVMAMFFDLIFSALIAFTFLALAVLLIIRYLMLGGLLIILPLAWLTYVFPKFDNSFSKWWNTFIRWVFFPPLALFFIYLAFIAATNTNGGNAIGVATNTNATQVYLTQATGLPSGAATGVEGSLYQETGLSGILQQAADEILLIGLTIMGLMFASSLAGKAGAVAVNIGSTASKAVAGYAGRQTKKGARLAYQKADKAVKLLPGDKGITQRLQEGAIPGLKYVPFGKRATSLVGAGISSIATNEELVKESQKDVPKTWDEAKSKLIGDMNTQKQFAHITLGVKEGRIKRDDMINGTRADEFLANEDLVKRYGQEKLVSDANKIWMGDADTRNAEKAIAAARKSPAGKAAYEAASKSGKSFDEALAAQDAVAVVRPTKDIKDENGAIVFKKGVEAKAVDVNEAAMKAFFSGMAKTDASKINTNSLFSPAVMNIKNPEGLEKAQRAIKQIAKYAPQIVPNLIKGMKGPTIRSFSKEYDDALTTLIEQYKNNGEAKKAKDYGEIQEIFQRSIRKSVFETADVEKGDGGGGDKDGGKGGGDKKDH